MARGEALKIPLAQVARLGHHLVMNNALTDDDLSDLNAVAERTGSDTSKCIRAGELDDGGERLIGLGLVEVRSPGYPGYVGSRRLGVSDAGLDELFERGLS